MTADTIVVEVPTAFLSNLASPGGASHGEVADQRWWDDDHDGWGAGGWLAMMGFMVIFWVAVALLVVWVVRSLSGGRPGPDRGSADQPPNPLDIARERYARGEINDEEFERIKAGLRR